MTRVGEIARHEFDRIAELHIAANGRHVDNLNDNTITIWAKDGNSELWGIGPKCPSGRLYSPNLKISRCSAGQWSARFLFRFRLQATSYRPLFVTEGICDRLLSITEFEDGAVA
jgi:hypothetical protein